MYRSNLCLHLSVAPSAAPESASASLFKPKAAKLLIHFQPVPLLICMLQQRINIPHAASISEGSLCLCCLSLNLINDLSWLINVSTLRGARVWQDAVSDRYCSDKHIQSTLCNYTCPLELNLQQQISMNKLFVMMQVFLPLRSSLARSCCCCWSCCWGWSRSRGWGWGWK